MAKCPRRMFKKDSYIHAYVHIPLFRAGEAEGSEEEEWRPTLVTLLLV